MAAECTWVVLPRPLPHLRPPVAVCAAARCRLRGLPVAACAGRGYRIDMDLRPPTPEFRELAERLRTDDESVGLAEAALRLAAEFQPGAALEPARTELARLGAAAARSVPANGSPAARAASLLEYLHAGCGFRGNELHYDDPRNSFLPEVLARRTGIPITLSIVAIEIAARAGFPLCGISFPGHFLARTVTEP